ncbi:MAG: ABC transporter permease [Sphingobacteriia bacterium]|nr:ABC transporter permease [Sphingobacteriia bacterium]
MFPRLILVIPFVQLLFTPIDSMPYWAQWISRCNPVTYFIEVMRMVVMKGSALKDLKQHFIIMSCFALVFNILAVLNYRKTT